MLEWFVEIAGYWRVVWYRADYGSKASLNSGRMGQLPLALEAMRADVGAQPLRIVSRKSLQT